MRLARTAALFLTLGLSPDLTTADTLRVATFNTELQRDGPGLFLRDLEQANDPQIAAVVEVIARVSPDILALQGIDWDHDGEALSAFAETLSAAGTDYPHLFSARPNTGMTTGFDLNGDGRLGEPEDAQGFGAFSGQGGLAVLSRFPILATQVQDFSDLLWRDLPGALMPSHEHGSPFPSAEVQAVQRLSATAHWALPISLPDGRVLTLLSFHATPPVFDGPEDRNGRRNHDEIRFWELYLDGTFGPAPTERFVIAGDANLDPFDSDGVHVAIRTLLDDPRLQDTAPESAGATVAPDQGHAGLNQLDTVDWEGPGRLRVDYILPSADWTVADSGVFWPAPGEDGREPALAASRHRLVWVDLVLD